MRKVNTESPDPFSSYTGRVRVDQKSMCKAFDIKTNFKFE
jgi:hypothetical protein